MVNGQSKKEKEGKPLRATKAWVITCSPSPEYRQISCLQISESGKAEKEQEAKEASWQHQQRQGGSREALAGLWLDMVGRLSGFGGLGSPSMVRLSKGGEEGERRKMKEGKDGRGKGFLGDGCQI